MDMQLPFTTVWPAGHVHVELTQVAPPGQTLPQVPQLRASLLRFAHAPPAHCMVPAPQVLEQTLLLHTWPVWHTVVQLPQWLLSDDTHWPPHNMPDVQTQALF
jgi:hypothetical protein